MPRKDAQPTTPFSWKSFFASLSTLCLLVVLLALLVGLVIGQRPLERRVASLATARGGGRTVVEVRWPTVPGSPSLTWLPQAQREELTQLAVAALAGDADRFSIDSLTRVGKAMGGSGWFDGLPTVRRARGNKVIIEGSWRVPAAMVRRDGVEQLISWEGKPMPLITPPGHTRWPVIDAPALPAPRGADGEVDVMTAWSGEDISASLELLKVILRQEWADQVAGVDLKTFPMDRGLVIATTFNTRVVWGGRVSKPALGEVSSSQKLEHLADLYARHNRIDAGYPLIYVNNSKLQFDISATAQALAQAQNALAAETDAAQTTPPALQSPAPTAQGDGRPRRR